ncbi:MAG: BON domain-containing protein [Acidobacteriia bacterium]|nr:BON domain-containing protein [Terriglobia bacterium]
MQKSELRIAAVIILGTILLAGCNVLQSLRAPDDKAITSSVQAKLFEDPVLKTRDIRVTAQNGVVTLTGSVGTDLEKGAVERMAGQVNGVRQVINQLVVGDAAAAPESQMVPSGQVATAESAPAERARPSRRHGNSSSAPAPETEPYPSAAPSAPPSAPATEAASAPAPAPPQPQSYTIPAGTVVTVRLVDSIDSSRSHAGEEFSATVDSPLVINNQVIVPRNSDARVRLVQAKSAGHMTGRSELEVTLVSVSVGGTSYPVESAAIQKQGASRGTRTAETVGGGAGLGALIGAIAGHGKGAAIGAAVGAGAGTAVQAATKGQQIQIPSETKLDFTLKAPLSVTM